MITIKKEKTEKEALTLFSVEIVLTPDSEDRMHMETIIRGHRAVVQAFLKAIDVDPKEYLSILKSAADAMFKDFMQQVVNFRTKA